MHILEIPASISISSDMAPVLVSIMDIIEYSVYDGPVESEHASMKINSEINAIRSILSPLRHKHTLPDYTHN